MGAPYSEDLRWKVVKAYEREEGSMRVLAKRFSVGLGFVRDLMKLYRETGDVKPRAYQRGVKPKVRGAGEEAVREWLREEPDLTLEALCARYQEAFGVGVSISAMDRALKRLKIRRKKRPSTIPSVRASRSNENGPAIKKAFRSISPST